MQYSCPVIYDSIPIIHQNQFFQNQRLCKQTYVQGQQTKEVVLLWHTITNDLWEREEGPRMYGKMMRILKLSGGVSGGHRTGRPSQLADTGQAQTAQWPRSEAALQGCWLEL